MQAEVETSLPPGSLWVLALSPPKGGSLAVQPWPAGGLLKGDSIGLAQTGDSYGGSKILSFIGQQAPGFFLFAGTGESLLSEFVSWASEDHSGREQ